MAQGREYTVMSTKPESLPAYLRTRAGCPELVLHCTWVQDYNICPRKFDLRYNHLLQSTEPRVALIFGAAVHAGLAELFRGHDVAAQESAIDAEFDARPVPSDEWRNATRAKELVAAYRAQPQPDWEVLGVEKSFEVEVGIVTGNDAMIPVYLVGRKDLIVKWHDGVWVVDHKTCTDWGADLSKNSHIVEGKRSFQFRGYPWAERERQRTVLAPSPAETQPCNNAPVLGTLGNYLCARKPYSTDPVAAAKRNGKGGSSLPREQFHLEPYPFEPAILDEWRNECLDVAQSILTDYERNHWRASDSGCGHWGRCEFYDYCEECSERRGALLSSSLYMPREFLDQ